GPLLAVEQADDLEAGLRFAMFPRLRGLDAEDPTRFLVHDDVAVHLQLANLRLLPRHPRSAASMRRVPKNVSSPASLLPPRSFLWRLVIPRPGRSFRFPSTDFRDRTFEIFQEIRGDPPFCVRIRPGGHRSEERRVGRRR